MGCGGLSQRWPYELQELPPRLLVGEGQSLEGGSKLSGNPHQGKLCCNLEKRRFSMCSPDYDNCEAFRLCFRTGKLGVGVGQSEAELVLRAREHRVHAYLAGQRGLRAEGLHLRPMCKCWLLHIYPGQMPGTFWMGAAGVQTF